MDEVSQAIGQLQGRVEAHEKRSERMEAKQDAMNEKLDRLLASQERQRGARRAAGLMATGGGSVLGAVFGWFLTWWIAKP